MCAWPARAFGSSPMSKVVTTGPISAERSAQPAPADEQPMEVPTIAGLEIEDAAVTMENRQEKTRRVVRDFNLKTGRLASGEPFDLDHRFRARRGPSLSAKVQPRDQGDRGSRTQCASARQARDRCHGHRPGLSAEGIPVQMRANSLIADVGKELYRLEALSVKTTWKGEGFPAAGVPVSCRRKISTPIWPRKRWSSAGSTSMSPAAISPAPHRQRNSRRAGVDRSAQARSSVAARVGAEARCLVAATTDPKVFEKLSFSGTVR